ncbi:transporter [Ganoderma sinense ZZ0214-1]|uniref:Transporter n=1 Tax=Ganoderma sinense ZZ0214-1 TaxID=1077348 RepID=A0A2G8RXC6_9APHY|nr:transporter [Ganoderma sinense ZZ0214-1]
MESSPSPSLIPLPPLVLLEELLYPRLPVEVIERIIDMSSADTKTLSDISQSCRTLLTRSRLRLFVRIHIRTMQQMRAVGDFLDHRPWLHSLIQRVAIGPSNGVDSSPIPDREQLALAMVVPLPLFKLPNLTHWEILFDRPSGGPTLSLNRSASSGFGYYGIHIRTLTLKHVHFPSLADFGRLLLAFSNIRDLEYSECKIAREESSTGDDVIQQRLAERLCLTCLSASVDELGRALLKTSHATLQHLTLSCPYKTQGRIIEEISQYPCLKSLSLEITVNELEFIDSGFTRRTFPFLENIQHLETKGVRKLDVTVGLKYPSLLHGFYNFLFYRVTPDLCHRLEATLLRSSFHPTLVLQTLGQNTTYATTSYRTQLWQASIQTLFPALNQQSRLRIENPEVFRDSLQRHEGPISTLVTSPNGPWFASGSYDSTIIIWDSRTGAIIYDWPAHVLSVDSLAFSPDGRYLCSTGGDTTPKIWDLYSPSGAALATTLVGHTAIVRHCAWSSSGTLLATGSNDGSVRLWDGPCARGGVCQEVPLANGQCSGTRVSAVEFCPRDGSWLFAIYKSSTTDAGRRDFRLWHFTAAGSPSRSASVQKDFGWSPPVVAAAFGGSSSSSSSSSSCSSQQLATVSLNAEAVCVWDLETEMQLFAIPFSYHHANVNVDLKYSLDGRSVVAPVPEQGFQPNKVDLWDTESGKLKLTFDGELFGLPSFSPDGSAAQVALAHEHVRAPDKEGEGDEGRITFVHADMTKLEYAEGSFDAVLAFYSIFHLRQEEQAPMVGRMVAWLQPGRYLLLNMGTEEGDFLSEDWMGARMFSSGIGVEGNRRAFEKHGKGLKILADEVATEMVGRFEEKSHWVFAVRE